VRNVAETPLRQLFDEIVELPAALREARIGALDVAEGIRTSLRMMLAFDELVQLAPERRMHELANLNLTDSDRLRLQSMLTAESKVPELLQATAVEAARRLDDDDELGQSLVGTNIGTFRLSALIGQGGSSAVFRAERAAGDGLQVVALKLLRTGLYSADAQRRFRREQAILAQLTHPNIASLIEGGVSEAGIPYIAMELVEGVPITHAANARTLSIEQRLVLFCTLCRTIQVAHAALVVHRDLKPSNLLITRCGDLKVLDFGIARLMDDDDAATHTHTVALTPEYAAPEQYRNDPLTTAVDIYALGVLLGELLTGKRLSANARASSSFAAKNTKDTSIPSGLPPAHELTRKLRGDLDSILAIALADEPAMRYRSANAFADDIERHLAGRPVLAHPPSRWYRTRKFVARHRIGFALTTMLVFGALGASGLAMVLIGRDQANEPSIAVLPFVNRSSDKEQEYFSDGLSEELLNQLAQVPQLRVIARTSSFSFKGKETDVATIAKALNVAHVLEGSVRKSGQTLRISAQLIRASDSSQLWSRTYDRDLTDVFKVQDEISGEVVAALKVKLLPAQQLPKAQGTGNTEAYEHYLRGIDFLRLTRLEKYPFAAAELQHALALDPDYANAYVSLAFAQIGASELAESQAQRAAEIRQAFASIEKALKLAPDLAAAYSMRGYMRFSRAWDWQGALADYQRALALDPNNAELLSTYAERLLLGARSDEALAMAQKATELDPLSITIWHRLGLVLFAAGRDVDARSAWQHAIGINAGARWPNYLLGYLDLRNGQIDRAIAHFKASDEPFRWTGTAMVEFTLGHAQISEQTLDALKTKYAEGWAFEIAAVHAWRGEKDLAFEWLERSYTQHDVGMTRLSYDPTLASLRDDPRFATLLKKMQFPQ
jgi:serine/threonine-protein kinase